MMNSLPLEVQIIVFQHLCQTDLLSSALACRAWRDVAWNMVMWQTLTIRLSGLLEILFGEDGLRAIKNDDSIPSVSDSNRFLDVVAKIRSLKLNVSLTNTFTTSLLEIADPAPGKVLFPALSTLDCGAPQDDLVHSLFIGSPIRRIRISTGGDRGGLRRSRRLLSSLLATQSQVQFIDADEQTMTGLKIQEFWRLPELRLLACYGIITYEDWTNLLQTCAKLERLSFTGGTRATIPTNPASVPAPSLRGLNLQEYGSLDLTISILESINAPRLEDLELCLMLKPNRDTTEDPVTARARSAFRLLAERSQRLESLDLRTTAKFGAEILASFRSLRRMSVGDYSPGCQLDDDGVELVCRSLPNLETFNLRYLVPNGLDCAKITPKSFETVARYCTDLTNLGLPVTVTARDGEYFADHIMTDSTPFGRGLKSLTLIPFTLHMKHVDDFVSFLLFQYPSLTVLDISLPSVIIRASYQTIREVEHNIRDVYFERQAAMQVVYS